MRDPITSHESVKQVLELNIGHNPVRAHEVSKIVVQRSEVVTRIDKTIWVIAEEFGAMHVMLQLDYASFPSYLAKYSKTVPHHASLRIKTHL